MNATSTALSSAAKSGSDVTDVDDVVLPTDTRTPIRLGFWVLVVGFGLFLVWALFAPLDEGVSAPSTVSIETKRKTIQHMQGGVIKELRAREGQEVKAGDVLVVLDDATTRAAFESIRQNYLSQRALESRLTAELTGAPQITFHKDVLEANDAVAQAQMLTQQQVFAARRAALGAEVAAAEQAITGLQAQIAGLNQVRTSRTAQAALQERQLAGVQSLASEGLAPRNQALQLEQQQAELRGSLAELEASIQRANSAIAETRQRIAQRRQEYLKESSTQLSEVRREVQANEERLSAIRAELDRTQIRTPVSGQVVGLALSGAGGVVTPGQPLRSVVPRDETLILDARVPPHVIDRVKAGDPTEVRFSSFANTPNLVVHGEVVTLSTDSITENTPMGPQTYFLARVQLTPEGMKALGDRTLHAGMQAETLIKTGERSMMTYLLHPLTKRIASAMIEE